MHSLIEILERQPKWRITLLCMLGLIIVGAMDFLTGVELSVAIFYLLPIALGTWFSGRHRGYLLSVAGAVVWLVAELLWSVHYSHLLVVFWNAAVRLAFFLIVVWLLAVVRSWNSELEVKVVERTGSLTLEMERRKRLDEERELLIGDLQEALKKVRQLRGLLPMCASCKRIRDDKGYWSQIEEYIRSHSEADFTHGICPDCAERLYPHMKARPS